MVRALTALKTAGRIDEALQFADAEVGNWPDSPDFWFALGDLYLECASQQPERALSDFRPSSNPPGSCLEIGERPQLDGAVIGRGSHMAAHNLAVFYETLGQKDLAARYHTLTAKLRPGG